MNINCWRITALRVAVLIAATLQHAAGQEFAFFREVEQPAAQPLLEDNDMARSLLFGKEGQATENLLTMQDIPADSLVDPSGNLVTDARMKIRNRTKQRLEEEKLLGERLKSSLKKASDAWIWLLTMLGCGCIVACGVMPAFLIKSNSDVFLQSPAGRRKLCLLLSFATGSLLGDVFLHLLPEVWSQSEVNMLSVGVWTLAGIVSCFVIEKCCSTTAESRKRVCAIMNLCANLADNFTHGLAIGGSFLVTPKLGFLTTFAIVIHELPHEISDFAILLRGNFTLWTAIKAQLLTALGGVLGACVALYTHSAFSDGEAITGILSFTAGSFINIGLCQILPDLMQESNTRQSMLQLFLILGGIVAMNVLNCFR